MAVNWYNCDAMTTVKIGTWKIGQIATQNDLTILSCHYSGTAVIEFIITYSFPYPPADLVCYSATPWAFGLSLDAMNQISICLMSQKLHICTLLIFKRNKEFDK